MKVTTSQKSIVADNKIKNNTVAGKSINIKTKTNMEPREITEYND